MAKVWVDSQSDFVEVKDKVRRVRFIDGSVYTSVAKKFDDEVTYEKRADGWYKIVKAHVRISWEVKDERGEIRHYD